LKCHVITISFCFAPTAVYDALYIFVMLRRIFRCSYLDCNFRLFKCCSRLSDVYHIGCASNPLSSVTSTCCLFKKSESISWRPPLRDQGPYTQSRYFKLIKTRFETHQISHMHAIDIKPWARAPLVSQNTAN